MIVPSHKLPSVNVKRTTPEAERSSGGAGNDGFRTDSQISGGRGIDRGLVKAGPTWTSAGDGGRGLGGDVWATTLMSAKAEKKSADALSWRAAAAGGGRSQAVYRRRWRGGEWPQGGVGGGLDGSIGDWDQFSANEKKFNVKASFDENLYTTKLDLSSIDAYQRAEAERIAKEIESTSSTNMHVAEERNQAIATDYDEEDRYSGVLTKDLKARAIVRFPAAAAPAVVKSEKAVAVEVGKVMNYAAAAQAAAKKGMAEMTLKPAAAAATVRVLESIPRVSEAIEKAEAAANKASSSQPVSSQQTKVSSEEEKSMPQWGHEKDAPIDEGDAKIDKSEKDEKKATPSSKLKLDHLKEDGGKVGLLEFGLVSRYDTIFSSHLHYL